MPVLEEFALSYNGYERLGDDPETLEQIVRPLLRTLDRNQAPPPWAGIDLVRGALFYLQREAPPLGLRARHPGGEDAGAHVGDTPQGRREGPARRSKA